MTIPKSIQGDYHHWHNFLDAEVQFSLADSEKHTKEHCARVLLFTLLIAVKNGFAPRGARSAVRRRRVP